jgi:AraC-like DNA-binding protein
MQATSGEGDQEAATIGGSQLAGLEHSCMSEGIVHSPSVRGIDRIEARFHGNAYSPHRHDTYAIGVTLSGVQTFRYRGVERFSLPGNIIVLHPDELHDGAAGTDDGLRYRMLYLPPERLIDATGGRRSLPFVSNPVIRDAGFHRCLIEALADLDAEPDELLLDDWIARFAEGLWSHADASNDMSSRHLAGAAVRRARDHLTENSDRAVGSAELEIVSGLDRYTLARHFRALVGTSPHRYLVMRRLEKSRAFLAGGTSLADTAFACGFADQAHFTRQFKSAFGMTPGRWTGLIKAG